MKYFGYTNRSSFWDFVKRCGVPHIRLNSRRIMFDERALADWLNRRTVGKTLGIGIDRFRGRNR